MLLSFSMIFFAFLIHNGSQAISCLDHGEIAGPSTFTIELTKFAPRPDGGYAPCNAVLSLEMSLHRNSVTLIFFKTYTFCHSMYAALKAAFKEHLSCLPQQFVKCRSQKDCFHPFHVNSYSWGQLTLPTTEQTSTQQASSYTSHALCAAEDPNNQLSLFLQASDLVHRSKSVFLPWVWISSSNCRTVQQDVYHPRTVLRILKYTTIFFFQNSSYRFFI